MSDEFQQLRDDISKFAGAPRIKAAFEAAAATWPVAVGALAAGFFLKPLLPVAFLGAAGYAGYKGVKAYLDYKDDSTGGSAPPPAPPRDFNIG